MAGSFRQWRKRLGVTQGEIARIVGLSQSEVSQIERSQNLAPKIRAALIALEERRREAEQHKVKAYVVDRAWREGGDSPAAKIAKAAMLDVAWKLLDRGDADLADELLDALPTTESGRLLDEFFSDDFGERGSDG